MESRSEPFGQSGWLAVWRNTLPSTRLCVLYSLFFMMELVMSDTQTKPKASRMSITRRIHINPQSKGSLGRNFEAGFRTA
jgi:hypothetical protein